MEKAIPTIKALVSFAGKHQIPVKVTNWQSIKRVWGIYKEHNEKPKPPKEA